VSRPATVLAPRRARPKPGVDPITSAVVRSALVGVTRSAAVAFRRTGMHPIIYETDDFAMSLYDDRMNLVTETAFHALFAGSLGETVPRAVEAVGRETLRPGDVLATNLPELQGMHPADGVVIEPVFHDGALVGFIALRSHMGDVGGVSFMPTATTEVLQEGLLLPPVRLYETGVLNEAIVDVIRANSRTPETTAGDWLAAVAGVRAGARTLEAVIARYGVETYRASVDELLDHGERVARAAIGRLSDGVYEAACTLDSNGVELGVPLTLRARVVVAGETLTLDLSESPPQQAAPLNCPWPTTLGLARMILKTLASPGTPANDGEFRVLEVVAPRGSLFNPRPEAASFWAQRPPTHLAESILAALAPALPDEIPAVAGSDVASAHSLLRHPRGGWRFTVNVCAPGQGARRGADGANALLVRIGSSAKGMSVEVIETRDPVLKHRYELDRDSGGPGRWRGGLGLAQEQEHLAAGFGFIASYMSNDVSQLQGLEGGLPPRRPSGVVFSHGDERVIGPPNCVASNVPIAPGDSSVTWASGGAGFGDALERDPAAVGRDVRDEYVSVAAALADYGVVVDEQGRVDEAATAAERRRRGRDDEGKGGA
jgi:N-methylhydantoinase B